MDKLEQFIKDNREDLDRYKPSRGVWRIIKTRLSAGKRYIPSWISVAAVVAVLLGSAAGLYSFQKRKAAYQVGTESIPGLKETEAYYSTLVNAMYSEAKPLLSKHPDIEGELVTDMTRLDSICTDIKKDLKDNIANQEVVEALIVNYRIKLQLLEDMLIVLKENENKPEKPESHEL